MRWIKTLSLALVVIILTLAATIAGFVWFAPVFGARANEASLERFRQSENYDPVEGRFRNLVPTRLDTSAPGKQRDLTSWFFPPEGKNPVTPLPSQRFDSQSLKAGDFVWLGHSSILFNTGELRVLVDPIFHRASPLPGIGKAFAFMQEPDIDSMPELDVILISHDHYDHLDHLSVRELNDRTAQFFVPLGIGAHLERWGVPLAKITEFDWYDTRQLGPTEFTLSPSRHFSGRGLTDRYKTLWGGWIVTSPGQKLYFSGDTGYFDEFRSIGERYGPFDIAFIENGAYDDEWREIHMFPEQAARASVDLRAKVFFPIHWSKFDLARHPWHEPIERATRAAAALGQPIATPRVGQVFGLDNIPNTPWWKISR